MENITEVKSVDSGVFPPKETDSLTHTPMSKKTRAAFRKLDQESLKDAESQTEAPKVTENAGDAQTPRRSSRKSVRPPLDYEDIMLRSATKGIITGNGPDAIHNQNDEMESHKWSVSEVGRHSAKVKRSRKSKRTTIMQVKEHVHVDADSVPKSPELGTIFDAKLEDSNTVTAELPLQALKSDVKLEDQDIMKAETAKQAAESDLNSENQAIMDTDTEPIIQTLDSDVKSIDLVNMVVEANSTEQIIFKKLNSMETEAKREGQVLDSVLKSNMEELGLCPLEFREEMPSLIVLDDDDSGEIGLNTTFDAETKEGEEAFEIDMPILQVSPEKNPSTIVISTNNDDKETIHLQADRNGKTKRSGSYRLPTPYKTKIVKKLPNTPNLTTNEEIVGDNGQHRRRSRSFSTMKEIKGKTVSFLSPIEVAHVHDIDKRWEGLDISNVTNRRKRSMSFDELLAKPSRLPQPKVYPKIFTPSKLNTRTKLPNFAAMHQKQFDKMENIVDHLERKAERAKALTNSALKQKQASESVAALAEDRSRQAQSAKKIDLFATAVKSQEKPHRRGQTPTRGVTPSKSKANVSTRAPLINENSFAVKPAFNLSTSLAKTFHANPMPSSKGGNKVEQRRQRHMEMFKGRTAKDNKGDFIKGVRLNRRFELQMQHRRFMEEEH